MAKRRRPKPKPIVIPKIDFILKDTHDTKLRDILIELKSLNNEAHRFMMGPYKVAKAKYHELQKTPIWERAKHLLLQYFILTNQFKCYRCKKDLDSRFCTLHHLEYNWQELFSPCFVCFVSARCHKILHSE